MHAHTHVHGQPRDGRCSAPTPNALICTQTHREADGRPRRSSGTPPLKIPAGGDDGRRCSSPCVRRVRDFCSIFGGSGASQLRVLPHRARQTAAKIRGCAIACVFFFPCCLLFAHVTRMSHLHKTIYTSGSHESLQEAEVASLFPPDCSSDATLFRRKPFFFISAIANHARYAATCANMY